MLPSIEILMSRIAKELSESHEKFQVFVGCPLCKIDKF